MKPGSFKARVFEIVRCIPKGKTLSYKQVAAAAGSPGACRAVGNVLKTNFDPKIPCHRVIRSNGETGGYNGGEREKVRKLKQEKAI